MPGPRFARNRPTGVSSPSGSSSSTRPSPIRSDAARTPCSSTVARCSTCAPKRRSYVDSAASRSSTATPRWWIPRACTRRGYRTRVAKDRVFMTPFSVTVICPRISFPFAARGTCHEHSALRLRTIVPSIGDFSFTVTKPPLPRRAALATRARQLTSPPAIGAPVSPRASPIRTTSLLPALTVFFGAKFVTTRRNGSATRCEIFLSYGQRRDAADEGARHRPGPRQHGIEPEAVPLVQRRPVRPVEDDRKVRAVEAKAGVRARIVGSDEDGDQVVRAERSAIRDRDVKRQQALVVVRHGDVRDVRSDAGVARRVCKHLRTRRS